VSASFKACGGFPFWGNFNIKGCVIMRILSIEVNTEQKAIKYKKLLGARFWMYQQIFYNDKPVSGFIVYYFQN
jgi:hypothetical protein